jgi:hypothetical protein
MLPKIDCVGTGLVRWEAVDRLERLALEGRALEELPLRAEIFFFAGFRERKLVDF